MIKHRKRILAYGDSNTWGYVPGTYNAVTVHYEQFSSGERWPTLLQATLGSDYLIIEEGLPGRTIANDDVTQPGMNGLISLKPCLLAHRPLDMVIIMLGSNDLKTQYQLTADKIVDNLRRMCRLIKSSQVGLNEGDPVICIVPPPIIHTQRLDKDFSPNFSLESDQKAKQLPGCYAALAKEEGACFCDPNQVFSTEKTDGLHFDAQGHSQMAALLEVVIQQVFT